MKEVTLFSLVNSNMVKPEQLDHLQLVFYLVYHFTVPLSSDCCHKYDDSTFQLFISPENSCVYICFINCFINFINKYYLTDFKTRILMLLTSSLLTEGFIQAILMSGRRHKKLNLLFDFSNSILINLTLFRGDR